MSLDACNGYLEAMGQMNNGCNHVSSYCLEKLPEATFLQESLAKYFSEIKTGISEPDPAEVWEFDVVPLEDWTDHLRKRLHHWFFEQEYSPEDKSGASRKNTVAGFLHFFFPLVGNATGFEVRTNPPRSFWYGCIWEDLAFASETGFWLLHFDFSD